MPRCLLKQLQGKAFKSSHMQLDINKQENSVTKCAVMKEM